MSRLLKQRQQQKDKKGQVNLRHSAPTKASMLLKAKMATKERMVLSKDI